MESDIIAEGFTMSKQMYGLWCKSVIADDDSSVMATIPQTVSYGTFINKVECANHACKACRSRLEVLAEDNPEYCRKGGLTKKVLQRLTVGARERASILTKSKVASFSIVALPLGLATQYGPNWTMVFWKVATKQNPGPVLGAHTSAKVQKLEQDCNCKQTVAYKQQRSISNKNSTGTTDHHYGPEFQQVNVTPSELLQLC